MGRQKSSRGSGVDGNFEPRFKCAQHLPPSHHFAPHTSSLLHTARSNGTGSLNAVHMRTNTRTLTHTYPLQGHSLASAGTTPSPLCSSPPLPALHCCFVVFGDGNGGERILNRIPRFANVVIQRPEGDKHSSCQTLLFKVAFHERLGDVASYARIGKENSKKKGFPDQGLSGSERALITLSRSAAPAGRHRMLSRSRTRTPRSCSEKKKPKFSKGERANYDLNLEPVADTPSFNSPLRVIL